MDLPLRCCPGRPLESLLSIVNEAWLLLLLPQCTFARIVMTRISTGMPTKMMQSGKMIATSMLELGGGSYSMEDMLLLLRLPRSSACRCSIASILLGFEIHTDSRIALCPEQRALASKQIVRHFQARNDVGFSSRIGGKDMLHPNNCSGCAGCRYITANP